MKIQRTLWACLLLGMALPAYAAPEVTTTGTLTMTRDRRPSGLIITLDWESSDQGNVTTTNIFIDGVIGRVVFNPDAGGEAPTANYDVTITDPDGVDVLAGHGANLSATVTKNVVPLIGDGTTTTTQVTTFGAHTLTITNAGDANDGVIRIYIDQTEQD